VGSIVGTMSADYDSVAGFENLDDVATLEGSMKGSVVGEAIGSVVGGEAAAGGASSVVSKEVSLTSGGASMSSKVRKARRTTDAITLSLDAYGREVRYEGQDDEGSEEESGEEGKDASEGLVLKNIPETLRSASPTRSLPSVGSKGMGNAMKLLSNPKPTSPPKSPPSNMMVKNLVTGEIIETSGVGITHTTTLPKIIDPWKPPAALQVMETEVLEDDPKGMLKEVRKETMILAPNHKHSRITFKTGVDKFDRWKQFHHSESEAPVTMWRWQHTPGSIVTRDIFECLDGLDGRQWIYFENPNPEKGKPAFETQHPGVYPTPPAPESLDFIGSSFPAPPSGHLPSFKDKTPHYEVRPDEKRRTAGVTRQQIHYTAFLHN